MSKRRFYLQALWLLLICFPLLPSSFAQTGAKSAGLPVKVSLLEPLNTAETKAGQTFSATVAEPVMSGKRVVLARGTAVEGRVTEVVRPGRLHQPATMTLVLTNVIGTRGNGGIQAQALQVDGNSHAVRNVALIGGGAAAGAVLGAVADGGKSALIGAGVGAGAGTATAYLTGKQELVLPVETELTFVIDAGSLAPPAKPVLTTQPPHIVESSAPVGRGAARNDDHRGGVRHDEQDAFDSLIFSERDRAIVRAYFTNDRGRNLPPGLAKRNGALPPGLEKQLRANGTLPPGLQKRAEPFPAELTRQLPPLPAGYARVILEGRAMNVSSDSRVVDLFVVFE